VGVDSMSTVSVADRVGESLLKKFFQPKATPGGAAAVIARQVSSLASGEPWPSICTTSASSRWAVLRKFSLPIIASWNWWISRSFWGATIYLNTPGLGALPVGLSSIRESPLFSFHAASETDIKGAFALFDEIDAYVAKMVPNAMAWIDSGLDVRFDAEFMAQVVGCIKSEGSLEKLIDSHAYYADMVANMDY
jgi:hypothetical protein